MRLAGGADNLYPGPVHDQGRPGQAFWSCRVAAVLAASARELAIRTRERRFDQGGGMTGRNSAAWPTSCAAIRPGPSTGRRIG